MKSFDFAFGVKWPHNADIARFLVVGRVVLAAQLPGFEIGQGIFARFIKDVPFRLRYLLTFDPT